MFVIKVFLCFQVFNLVSYKYQAFTINGEDEQELIHGIVESCKNKEMGSDEDVKLLEKFEIPNSKEGKCMMACVLESAGIVSCFFDFLDLISIIINL